MMVGRGIISISSISTFSQDNLKTSFYLLVRIILCSIIIILFFYLSIVVKKYEKDLKFVRLGIPILMSLDKKISLCTRHAQFIQIFLRNLELCLRQNAN